MTPVKMFTLPDFLTLEEIRKATDIYQADRTNFHKRVLEEIVEPNMERINTSLGQENDAGYLVYVVEFVIGKYGNQGP